MYRLLLLLPCLALPFAARPLCAQVVARTTRAYVTAGAIGPASALTEGSGVEVRTTIGAYAEGDLTRALALAPFAVGLFARLATARTDVRVGGASYAGGHVVQAVIGVRAVQHVSSIASLRAGLGAAYVHGPGDLRPYSSGSRLHPAADLLLGLDLGRAARWSVDGGATGYYVGTSDAVDHAGFVTSLLVGLRRAL